MASSVKTVPYGPDGSLLHYAGYVGGAVWRDNEPFHASFQIDSIRSGRSAKYLVLTAVNNPDDRRTFPMFVTDFVEAARMAGISKGGIMSGRWMVAKRGQNYGVKMLSVTDENANESPLQHPGFIRVYMRAGRRAHLLSDMRSPNSYASAICLSSPNWPDSGWRGTGSQIEQETAQELPLCLRCANGFRARRVH